MKKPSIFILDVDGVMTDGMLYYTIEGKVMKRFGPDDHDGLNLIKQYLPVQFISGDAKGFAITAKRIRDDMQYPLELVSTIHRRNWIAERYPLDEVIYMGDGIFDALVLGRVGYGIAPSNASPLAKSAAHFVTQAAGGDRAVAEACIHLLEKFFEPLNLEGLLVKKIEVSGT
ncbi:HAD hydrolase family protein [Methylocapsa polymorpha]|uniref:HAD hydrolase family protein n=1 Tax=Methylocapsa polymorpha TaxID=3080828 RepID=A0ABZ0HSJ3_9HYPH|nr:HAD hydrolase family protein [Methylocapsa sp. RX1]